MTIHSILLLLLFFSLPVKAEITFDALFDVDANTAESSANRITSFHAENINLSFTEKLTELNELEQNIDTHIKASPEDPVLWFLKGLNYSNLASVYNAQRNQRQVNVYIDRKNSAYQKAIELDQSKNILSAAIYATMKHGLPEELKITAIQKELALGGNGENESYYWYLHWSNINELEKAGRKQEAELALKNMKAEMLEQGVNNPDYDDLTYMIEQQINPVTSTEKEKNSSSTSQRPKNQNKKIVSLSDFTWLFVVIAIIALVLAWKYELFIFKKKN